MLLESMLETSRLILLPESMADAEAIWRMNSDERVMRFIGDGRAWTSPLEQFRQQHRAALERVRDAKYGFASVRLKETGQFIGLCWLAPCRHLGGNIELGYRYIPSAWGHGYATEAGAAVLEIGFAKLGLEKVEAIAYPENVASRRVLEKLSFRQVGDFTPQTLARQVLLYRASR